MTKYEPVTFKSTRNVFLWTLLLSPIILFLLTFIISLFVKGYSDTLDQVNDFLHKIDIALTTGYFIVFALMFTLIIVLSNLYHNYKWKKFFTSDAINSMRKYGFTFNQEGIDGEYKGVKVAIRYYKWKDTESTYILLLKTQSVLGSYSQIENHDFGKDYTLTNYDDVFEIEINIKGRRRKKELDFQRVIDKAIKFVETQPIDLLRGQHNTN